MEERTPRRARCARFVGAVAAVTIVWLAVLPWIAGRPATAAYLDWLEEEGIDPSAMYYTELEMMEPILTRLALEARKGIVLSGAARTSRSADAESDQAKTAETGRE